LIAWDGWEGLGKNMRINDLYRMAIFCQDDADLLFNIEVKKSQISITDSAFRNSLKSKIMNFVETARKPYQKRAHLSLRDLSDIWEIQKNKEGKVLFILNRKSKAIELFKKGDIIETKLLEFIENTIPYESLLYYLNLNKVDNNLLKSRKLASAEVMLEHGLITAKEFEKLKLKYES
jgi:hypothetical protein